MDTPHPLDFATTEELVEALKGRFDSVVVLWCHQRTDEQERFHCEWYGSMMACLGMVSYAQPMLENDLKDVLIEEG